MEFHKLAKLGTLGGQPVKVYPGFLPSDVADQVLWLDSADTSPTNIVESGGSVSRWSDKSGQGNHATQGLGARQPTTGGASQNNLNLISFTSPQTLELPSALYSLSNGPMTIFAIAKRTSEDASTDTIICFSEGGSGRTWLRFEANVGRVNWTSSTSGGGFIGSNGNTNTNIIRITAKRSGILQSISTDASGTTVNTNAQNVSGIDAISIGSQADTNFRLEGNEGELIIYNRLLSLGEVSLVENYLDNKWGLV